MNCLFCTQSELCGDTEVIEEIIMRCSLVREIMRQGYDLDLGYKSLEITSKLYSAFEELRNPHRLHENLECWDNKPTVEYFTKILNWHKDNGID